jgi:hypothetical protein
MKAVDCKPQQLAEIGNRLLDWFSVIMSDSKSKKKILYAHKFQGELCMMMMIIMCVEREW